MDGVAQNDQMSLGKRLFSTLEPSPQAQGCSLRLDQLERRRPELLRKSPLLKLLKDTVAPGGIIDGQFIDIMG